ncbi:MAG: hypothetical protein QNJ51_25780 [Calothrix sp. MO_167.B12]|nr:hypothetical protein [Calothrix sp. MO_167.B12]
MAEPTLTEIFGAGATQDATTVTITKASLFGLTPTASNTAESLLAAINLTARQNLTQDAFNADTDRSIYVGTGFPGFANRGANNDQYRIDQLTINLAKLDTQSNLNPNDY